MPDHDTLNVISFICCLVLILLTYHIGLRKGRRKALRLIQHSDEPVIIAGKTFRITEIVSAELDKPHEQ